MKIQYENPDVNFCFYFYRVARNTTITKKKHWNELATFVVLFVIGFTLSFLHSIDVNLPNPNKGIEYLIKLVQSMVV
ncbi:MAG: hypothetical protein H6Q70_943 [Firmicutes bacterium]|nr:hypothetical protein [Bacillota bacterium]